MSAPSSFSLSDVRAQLLKLGYANVPDVVIEKFMTRMKAKAEADAAAAPTETSRSVNDASTSAAAPTRSSTSSLQPNTNSSYAPATLPLPVTYTSSLASLSTSSLHYSSLANPLEKPPHTSQLPLPLSLRTNPAFAAQQAASILPSPSFAQSDAQAQQQSHYQAYQAALAKQHQLAAESAAAAEAKAKKRAAAMAAMDEGSDGGVEDTHAKKLREIDAYDSRLKFQAAVAHGQTRQLAERERERMEAAEAQKIVDQEVAAKENVAELEQSSHRQPPRGSPSRSFGTTRAGNNANVAPSPHKGAYDWAEKPSARGEQSLAGSASARTLRDSQPRSILRPSSVQLRQQQQQQAPLSARPATAATPSRQGIAASRASGSSSARQQQQRPHSASIVSRIDHHHPGHCGPAGGNVLSSSRGRGRQQQAETEQEEEEAVLHVENIDTQRTLRKTYANSVQKFKRMNPRYGAGGYRKSDPVTLFHAFKGAWQSSKFLKKTAV